MRASAWTFCGEVNEPLPATASVAVSNNENATWYRSATSCSMFCTDAPVSAAVTRSLPPVFGDLLGQRVADRVVDAGGVARGEADPAVVRDLAGDLAGAGVRLLLLRCPPQRGASPATMNSHGCGRWVSTVLPSRPLPRRLTQTTTITNGSPNVGFRMTRSNRKAAR
jgi:hypothetical protein